MNRITAIALFAIANFAMAGNSFAQSRGVQATVPFDFTVGNTLVPAGAYTIKGDSSHMLVITNRDKPITVLGVAIEDAKKSPKGGRLVFHKYGDQYFLSEILCDSADMNLQMPASKKEQRVRLQQARLTGSSQTLVAAR